jgi:iron complex outermembrane receptor protein
MKIGAISVGLFMCCASGVASAQEAAALDEVQVTARRVEENLQVVPVAITAFTAADLEKQGIKDVRDIANFTSNLTFTTENSGRNNVPTIRGIGLIDARGFDNPVGVFIDGIFVSGRASNNVSMLDLERVEVIKGPQSALYGRNTFSGAINYVTRPTPKEFSAKAEATVGTDRLWRFSGSFGGPITDTVAGRLALSYDSDDGTYRNSGPLGLGNGIGGALKKSALLSLRFTPREDLTIDTSGYWSREKVDNLPNTRLANNCGRLDPMNPANAQAISSDLNNFIYYCGEAPPNGSGFLSMSPEAFSYVGETKRGTVTLDWELPGVSIQSLTAYTTVNNYGQNDLDRTQAGDGGYGYMPLSAYVAAGSPNFICSGFIPAGPCSAAARGATAGVFNQIRPANFNTYFGATVLDSDYWSSELRFTSSREKRLRWLGGLFYFRSKNDEQTLVGIDASEAVRTLGLQPAQIKFLLVDPGAIIPGLAPRGIALNLPPPAFPPNAIFLNGPGVMSATYTPLVDVQKSIFGSVEFDFTDRLTGTLEMRHTSEAQHLDNLVDIYFGGRGSFDASSSFNDPRVTVRFKQSETLMLYASAARGTRSGGINALITDPAYITYDPETNNTYELGFKSTLAGGRVRLNASVFQIDWSDAQFRQAAPGSQTTGTLVNATLNVGSITSKGFEVSLAANLTEHWSVDANVGFSDPKFDSQTYAQSLERLCTQTAVTPVPITCVGRDIDGNGTIDRFQPDISGKQLLRTSKVTASLGLEYSRPIFSDAKLVARLDGAYRGKQYGDFINSTWVAARTRANLRVGLEREHYDLVLWCENLTDDDTPDQASENASNNLAASFAWQTTSVNLPQRRYGVTARYRF